MSYNDAAPGNTSGAVCSALSDRVGQGARHPLITPPQRRDPELKKLDAGWLPYP